MLMFLRRTNTASADGLGDGFGYGDCHGAGIADDTPDGDGAVRWGGRDGDGYGESEERGAGFAYPLVEAGVEKLYLLMQILNNQGE
jgi:hypothetical protein